MLSGLSASTRLAAVIGHPVRHSLSPVLYNAAFRALDLDWAYAAFDVAPGDGAAAVDAMRTLGIDGLSVTMPHKEAVAGAVDELSDAAAALGAVNCVGWRGDVVVGENTDGAGLLDALRHDEGFTPAGARCVVLGAGGAGRAVVQALAAAGAADVAVWGRTRERAETAAALAGKRGRVVAPGSGHPGDPGDNGAGGPADGGGLAEVPGDGGGGLAEVPGDGGGGSAEGEADAGAGGLTTDRAGRRLAKVDGGEGPVAAAGPGLAEAFGDYDVLVNATPVGMPHSPGMPLDSSLLRAGTLVVDLIYHPPVTPLLEAARSAGAVAVNGLGMLIHQAAHQFRLWTGEDPPLEVMSAAAARAIAHR